MATTIQKVYEKHLAKAQLERVKPNLTPSQKAKLTKRIKRLQRQMEWLENDSQNT